MEGLVPLHYLLLGIMVFQMVMVFEFRRSFMLSFVYLPVYLHICYDNYAMAMNRKRTLHCDTMLRD